MSFIEKACCVSLYRPKSEAGGIVSRAGVCLAYTVVTIKHREHCIVLGQLVVSPKDAYALFPIVEFHNINVNLYKP